MRERAKKRENSWKEQGWDGGNEIRGVCVVRDTAGMRVAEARGNRGETHTRSAAQRSAPASTLVAHQKKPETPTSTHAGVIGQDGHKDARLRPIIAMVYLRVD